MKGMGDWLFIIILVISFQASSLSRSSSSTWDHMMLFSATHDIFTDTNSMMWHHQHSDHNHQPPSCPGDERTIQGPDCYPTRPGRTPWIAMSCPGDERMSVRGPDCYPTGPGWSPQGQVYKAQMTTPLDQNVKCRTSARFSRYRKCGGTENVGYSEVEGTLASTYVLHPILNPWVFQISEGRRWRRFRRCRGRNGYLRAELNRRGWSWLGRILVNLQTETT